MARASDPLRNRKNSPINQKPAIAGIPKMLRFERFSLINLEGYLPSILRSEEVFPADLRETAESCREALGRDRGFGLALYDSDDYAGNAIGFGIAGPAYRDLGLDAFRPMDTSVVYLFNIVTLPEFRGRGHGKRLLAEFCDRAAMEGFTTLAGHFRDNGSLKNFLEIGGVELGRVEDWFGTGETYAYCERALEIPAGWEGRNSRFGVSSGTAALTS